jgi:hypothetical protein
MVILFAASGLLIAFCGRSTVRAASMPDVRDVLIVERASLAKPTSSGCRVVTFFQFRRDRSDSPFGPSGCRTVSIIIKAPSRSVAVKGFSLQLVQAFRLTGSKFCKVKNLAPIPPDFVMGVML